MKNVLISDVEIRIAPHICNHKSCTSSNQDSEHGKLSSILSIDRELSSLHRGCLVRPLCFPKLHATTVTSTNHSWVIMHAAECRLHIYFYMRDNMCRLWHKY